MACLSDLVGGRSCKSGEALALDLAACTTCLVTALRVSETALHILTSRSQEGPVSHRSALQMYSWWLSSRTAPREALQKSVARLPILARSVVAVLGLLLLLTGPLPGSFLGALRADRQRDVATSTRSLAAAADMANETTTSTTITTTTSMTTRTTTPGPSATMTFQMNLQVSNSTGFVADPLAKQGVVSSIASVADAPESWVDVELYVASGSVRRLAAGDVVVDSTIKVPFNPSPSIAATTSSIHSSLAAATADGLSTSISDKVNELAFASGAIGYGVVVEWVSQPILVTQTSTPMSMQTSTSMTSTTSTGINDTSTTTLTVSFPSTARDDETYLPLGLALVLLVMFFIVIGACSLGCGQVAESKFGCKQDAANKADAADTQFHDLDYGDNSSDDSGDDERVWPEREEADSWGADGWLRETAAGKVEKEAAVDELPNVPHHSEVSAIVAAAGVHDRGGDELTIEDYDVEACEYPMDDEETGKSVK